MHTKLFICIKKNWLNDMCLIRQLGISFKNNNNKKQTGKKNHTKNQTTTTTTKHP